MGRHAQKKPQTSKVSTKEKLKLLKKEKKQKLKQKRARLIIRNLPFDSTEENLKEHFQKFGEIEDVKILKKEDGLLVGCGFVQFKLVQKAAKARHHLNEKPFLGRNISVDFALAKNKYVTEKTEIKKEDEVQIKEEPIDADEVEVTLGEIKTETENENKDETYEESEDKGCEAEEECEDKGSEAEEECEDKKSEAEEECEDKKSEAEEESDNDESSADEEEDDDVDDGDDISQHNEETPAKKLKFESNDVVEGRTIFIKNVPFSATNEDLKECMKQFGPVYYALICVDKYTEHSKGTAFVKFVNVEDAEKALSAGTELTLMGNVLDCHKALGRNEVRDKTLSTKEDKTAKKDSRNLYLVKEGVILAGTKAAEGVSAGDMAKRLQLEQYKTQMLRNLNMFVSRERLAVHNLPASWDDTKFRALIQNNSPKNSVIREARVMRDLRNVDANGIGRSKEFGFVTFTRHEDALATLRTLNNNPNVFSANKRPIVAFSIENKAMIKAKQRRLEKSRQKNPKSKEFDPNVVRKDEEKRKKNDESIEERQGYVGVAAKPGVQKMRSRYNLKTQAKLHHENLKKEKKKVKMAKKSFKERKQDFTKQPKQKINKKKQNNDHFAKLVSDYKKKLLAPPSVKKTKWYE